MTGTAQKQAIIRISSGRGTAARQMDVFQR